jgi:HEAT repeat protein
MTGAWIRTALLTAGLGLSACGGEAESPTSPPLAKPTAVAPAPPPSGRAAVEPPPEPRRPTAQAAVREPAPEPRLPEPELDDVDYESQDLLASSSAEDRIEGLEQLDPDEAPQLRLLEELVADDPDPEVRVAAVETLADAFQHGAIPGLIRALDDPDPRVVVAAIEGVSFAGDATLIPDLVPLVGHRDPEVREAAVEAIELLE